MGIQYTEQVKEPGLKLEYTKEEINELFKCKNDFFYFSKYIKIMTEEGKKEFKLYPFQEEMIEMFEENRFNIILSSRQSGKCVDYDTIIEVKYKEEIFKIKIRRTFWKN